MVKKRAVRCKNCGWEFDSGQKKPRCGKCGSYEIVELVEKESPLSSVDDDEIVTPPEGDNKNPDYNIPLGVTSVKLDVEDLADIQELIRCGVAPDIKGVFKKGVKSLGREIIGGRYNMEQSKKSPEETLKDIRAGRILEAETERIKAEAEKIKSGGKQIKDMTGDDLDALDGEITKILKRKLMLSQISDITGKNNGSSSEMEALKQMIQMQNQQIQTLQQQKQYEELHKSNEELRRMIIEMQTKNTGNTQTDLITKMTQIFADRDKDLQKMQAEIAKAKEEAKDAVMSTKLERLTERISQLGNKNSSWADALHEMRAAKQLGKEIAKEFKEDKEKGSGELAKELIESTIEKVRGPLLEPIGQAMAEKIANSPMPGAPMPQPYGRTIQPQPAPMPMQPVQQEAETRDGLVQIDE